MGKNMDRVVVLGTGGTIAGTAESSSDHTGYTAAQLSIEQLMHSVPVLTEALQGRELVVEQVAQLDSKDMDLTTLAVLAQRCLHYFQQPGVRGIVITHGTDTLEETAYFLHLVLSKALPQQIQAKPVVLTCAMRPATSSEADGSRNLRDAIRLVGDAQASGVLVVCAGDVHHAVLVQKVHTYGLNAFSSGCEIGADGSELVRTLAHLDSDRVHWHALHSLFYQRNWHAPGINIAMNAINSIVSREAPAIRWPRVEIILNHSHQDGQIVHALLAASSHDDPLRGIVVAATGQGTVSAALQKALDTAAAQGVRIKIASRCHWDDLPQARPEARQAVKARIGLMLELLL